MRQSDEGRQRKEEERGGERQQRSLSPPRTLNASVAPSRVWHGSASPVPARNQWELLGIP